MVMMRTTRKADASMITQGFWNYKPDILRRLNSAAKYPSILTYHAIGDKGRLTGEVLVEFPTDEVIVTEKIDGTNARIIIHPRDNGLIIGSREELLHYTMDLLPNPALGIVDAIDQTTLLGAFTIQDHFSEDAPHITAIYGEVYGDKVGKAGRQYTSQGQTGFRVFDIARIPLDVLDLPIEKIAAWRDAGNQFFLPDQDLVDLTLDTPLRLVPASTSPVPPPPRDISEALTWLHQVAPVSRAVLDSNAGHQAEGVVVRSADRAAIAKLRFEDYQRTLTPTPQRKLRHA